MGSRVPDIIGHSSRCVAMIVPAVAMILAAAPAAGAVRLEGARILTLGEPVRAVLVIENTLEEAIAADLGQDRTEKITVRLRFPDGSSEDKSERIESGVSRVSTVNVEPGGTYRQQILFDLWFNIDQIGTYTAAVTLTGDVVTESGEPVATVKQWHWTFTVTARNPASLAARFEQLARLSIGADDVNHRLEAARALSVVQDPLALPYLRWVLSETDKLDFLILRALARIGTREAIEVLQGAASSELPERATLARDVLRRPDATIRRWRVDRQ